MKPFLISRRWTGLFVQSSLVALVLAAAICSVKADSDEESGDGGWPVAGQNIRNTRSAVGEQKIGRSNVKTLKPKWVFTTGSDVSATPTVAGDAVYFSDWAGNLYAVRKSNGQLIWSHAVAGYDNFAGSLSRVSPAVHGDDLIIGDIESAKLAHNGANIIAVNRYTGNLHWITRVDKHVAAIITGSPVVADGVVYVGVSSNEEGLAVDPAYPCCSFRGSTVALNATTGQILWQTFNMPDNHGQTGGFSGGAIWQPVAVDKERGLLFVGTGNNYEVPDSVKQCLTATPGNSACLPADDLYDTALALDLRTGRVKWAKRLQGVDVWTVACVRSPTPVSCPLPASPDFDLSGSGPNLLPNIVGFGQKSGIYWALNPANGNIVWSTVVGPGGLEGGIQWGTATDGNRIYVAVTNSVHKPYPLVNGKTITWGAWSALDARTGKILWQTADPDQAVDKGAVSVANGVVYAPSFTGNFHALNSSTGEILWSFQSGGSVIDGPSIVNGMVFWGSGYRKSTDGVGNNKLFAFTAAVDAKERESQGDRSDGDR